MTYPQVIGEFDTIRAVLSGRSLARLGDGELKIAHGSGYSREPVNETLTREVKRVMQQPDPRCLIGIPTMDPAGPKYQNWTRHQKRFEQLLNPGVQYVSAFVTRPDSAPWIRTREYAELVQSIWAGKRAVVICERSGSMLSAVAPAAASVVHIECPHDRAYSVIGDLKRAAIRARPDVVIIAAGPTATCLAHRLAKCEIQAVDLGSAGGFLRALLA